MRDKYIRIRLSEDERIAFDEVSKKKGLTISSLVRNLIEIEFKKISNTEAKD